MQSAAEDVRAEHEFRFVMRPLLPPRSIRDSNRSVLPPSFFRRPDFRIIFMLPARPGCWNIRRMARSLHQYAVGRELPGSPLVAVRSGVLTDSREPELILATANDGLLAFNGRAFRQILPATQTHAPSPRFCLLLPDIFLIGTKKRGVLVYDGKQITRPPSHAR